MTLTAVERILGGPATDQCPQREDSPSIEHRADWPGWRWWAGPQGEALVIFNGGHGDEGAVRTAPSAVAEATMPRLVPLTLMAQHPAERSS
jgi:hypothetical protein